MLLTRRTESVVCVVDEEVRLGHDWIERVRSDAMLAVNIHGRHHVASGRALALKCGSGTAGARMTRLDPVTPIPDHAVGASIAQNPCPSSGRVRLESMDALVFADVGDNSGEVVLAETGHGCHVAEVPVVCGHASHSGEDECCVAVVVRLINDRQVRWTNLGSSKVRTVTRRAGSLIHHLPRSHEVRILDRNASASVGLSRIGSERHDGDDHHHEESRDRDPRCVSANQVDLRVLMVADDTSTTRFRSEGYP